MEQSRSAQQSPIRNPQSAMRMVGWAVAGLVVALVAALLLTLVMLRPPSKDIQDLVVFLLISGGVSIVLGAIGFRLGLGTRLPSLAITMALVYLVGVAVVGVNV